MGIEQHLSPAFAENSSTNPDTSNFLTLANQTR
jgi:hypothetical protein